MSREFLLNCASGILSRCGRVLFSNWELDGWEGNRKKGQDSPNGGNSLQVSDIFISLKRQEETNSWFFFFFPFLYKFKRRFLLKYCCHNDTWFHLKLTLLKPRDNQCLFLMEMFVLSYANVLCIYHQTLSSSWFRLLAQNLLDKPVLRYYTQIFSP